NKQNQASKSPPRFLSPLGRVKATFAAPGNSLPKASPSRNFDGSSFAQMKLPLSVSRARMPRSVMGVRVGRCSRKLELSFVGVQEITLPKEVTLPVKTRGW